MLFRSARADSSRSRTAGSTGLGLAIVDAVVQAHGGSVEVTSEPGDTVFTVHLPTEQAPTPAPVAAPAVVAPAGPAPEQQDPAEAAWSDVPGRG